MLTTTNVTEEILGTMFHISVVHDDAHSCDEVLSQVIEEGRRIETTYSRFKHKNELAKVNKCIGKWCKVSEEFFELLKFAREMHGVTDGIFDITVKSILEGWGYDASYSLRESFEGKIGGVELDEEGHKVRVSAPIELGGFGKGYAVDKMAEIFLISGVNNFWIDGGGDIFCKGRDVEGEMWRVHFGHPVNSDEAIGFVDVDGFACAASSANRRTWNDKHHLVNPKYKEPADNMLAVHTQSKHTMIADAYATAFFVMGYEKAKEWMENQKNNARGGGLKAAAPIEAMLISPTGNIFVSEGFQGRLYTS